MSENNPTPIQRLCVDLGNGGLKGATVRVTQPAVLDADGVTVREPEVRELATAYLPAKVGVGTTTMGALSLGKVGRRGHDEMPIQVSWEEGTYLVGPNVERYAQVLERFDAGKYTDSPELRAVTWALLAQLVNGGPNDLALIVALPVEVMMASNVKDMFKGLRAWLVGEHKFSYDGIESRVCVHDVRAMAQPVGAFFDWALDLNGELAQNEDDFASSSIAVLDSGFNTLDLLVVQGGKIQKRFTGGDNLGVRVAAQDIANALDARYGIKWSLVEIDALIREYLDRGKVSRIFAGQKADLTPIVKQALNSLATRTTDFVQETWGNAREFSHVLLAGGGALALDAAIRRHIPHAQMLENPVHANARGLAKYAQLPNVFKGV